ncbi:MAG: ribose 5-phosphate isomerase B [Armatimonadetes bacterium CG_4_10_14_3_um_filter_66_18]|nr:ribose 5-phosphate isomerase B [Armatimonadota bacterium]OIP01226.1 MAG: ribose 5-phosphate isomerase B [Armatimonadetes bacterium CG2_30_66_41]PIU93329.1 MAG: ribose 5-phosphate isomerase B [Armatimonadetes bacterium CG06_land_8_20_14_3_00_66_21]PIX36856.1 MAG: ribose 5-phosphate isomerase B [Armatimonadetes bacterium CG_4_8_14_3_um_filter_66_20]PIY41288.1 MAG: ribose 5-phosphate isomerase B [Armatimonadetes bacterium CG_4_10_14_3_um_filter_66_18]PIZ40981.1 MAG: ribose 5-phosphate isomeras
MKIAIGSDHAGFVLKEHLRALVSSLGHEVDDFGCYSCESVDYPDVSLAVARSVAAGRFDRGILVCGSGQGTCIAANKIQGIRATLCNDLYAATYTRSHNDANVMTLGERIVGPGLAEAIVATWLATEFSGDARHQRRIDKIHEAEQEGMNA